MALGLNLVCCVFVNKVLLDHDHIPSFTYQSWLFHATKVESRQFLQRPYGLQSLKKFLSGPLQKQFTDP